MKAPKLKVGDRVSFVCVHESTGHTPGKSETIKIDGGYVIVSVYKWKKHTRKDTGRIEEKDGELCIADSIGWTNIYLDVDIEEEKYKQGFVRYARNIKVIDERKWESFDVFLKESDSDTGWNVAISIASVYSVAERASLAYWRTKYLLDYLQDSKENAEKLVSHIEYILDNDDTKADYRSNNAQSIFSYMLGLKEMKYDKELRKISGIIRNHPRAEYLWWALALAKFTPEIQKKN